MPHHRLLALSVATCSLIAAAGPALAAEPTPAPTPTITAAVAAETTTSTPTATPSVAEPIEAPTTPVAESTTPAAEPVETPKSTPSVAAPVETPKPTTPVAEPVEASTTPVAEPVETSSTPSATPTPTKAPIATAKPLVYTHSGVQVSCGTDAQGRMTLTATVNSIDPRITTLVFSASDGQAERTVQLAQGQTSWSGTLVLAAGSSLDWELAMGDAENVLQVESGMAQCTVDPLNLAPAQISFHQNTCGVPGMPVDVIVTATNPNDREVSGAIVTQSDASDRAEHPVAIPAHGSVSVTVKAPVAESLTAGVQYAASDADDPSSFREAFRATTFDVDQCTEDTMPQVDAVAVCRLDGKADLSVDVTNPADVSKYTEQFIVVAGVGKRLDEALMDIPDGETKTATLVVPVGDIEIVVAATRTGDMSEGFIRGVTCSPKKSTKPTKPSTRKPSIRKPATAKPAPATTPATQHADGGKGSDGPGLASTGEGM